MNTDITLAIRTRTAHKQLIRILVIIEYCIEVDHADGVRRCQNMYIIIQPSVCVCLCLKYGSVHALLKTALIAATPASSAGVAAVDCSSLFTASQCTSIPEHTAGAYSVHNTVICELILSTHVHVTRNTSVWYSMSAT